MKNETIKRQDIKDCPQDATHVLMNPTGEFIQMFYHKDEYGRLQYRSFAGSWMYSESAEKDKTFESKLILIN